MIGIGKLCHVEPSRSCARAAAPILSGFPVFQAREREKYAAMSVAIAAIVAEPRPMSAFSALPMARGGPSRQRCRRCPRHCCARLRGHLPLDHPIDRSLHRQPVTRAGGLAIWAGFLPAALLDARSDRRQRCVAGRRGARSPRCRSPTIGAASRPAFGSSCTRWRRIGGRRRRCSPAIDVRRHSRSRTRSSIALAAFAIRLVGQPVQLHGWQRRLGGADGGVRVRRVWRRGVARGRAGRRLSRARGGDAAVPRRRTCRRRACSWATAARCRSGFSPRCSASPASARGTWPGMVPAARVSAVHRRYARDDDPAHRRGRKPFPSAQDALLSTACIELGAGHAGTLLFYGVLIAGTSASAYFALATRPAAGWQVLGRMDGRNRRLFRRH